MTTVRCDSTECENNGSGICQLGTLQVEHYEGCYEYEDITEGPEYQDEFWTRQKDGSRKRYFGKKIEMCGMTFYTTNDVRTESDRNEALMTEASTGIGCGRYTLIEERIEQIKKCVAEIKKPLMELPIYERISG
jgi:hypothetical protein